jgi:hypothetical protein
MGLIHFIYGYIFATSVIGFVLGFSGVFDEKRICVGGWQGHPGNDIFNGSGPGDNQKNDIFNPILIQINNKTT